MDAETVDVMYRGLAVARGAKWLAGENKVELDAPMPVGTDVFVVAGGKARPARITKVIELERPSIVVTFTGEARDAAAATVATAPAPTAAVAPSPADPVASPAAAAPAVSEPVPMPVPDAGSDAQTTVVQTAPPPVAAAALPEPDQIVTDPDSVRVDLKQLQEDDGGKKGGKRKRRHTLIGR